MSEIKALTPCLWFNGTAEEAFRHYRGIFADTAEHSVSRMPAGENGEPGPVLMMSVAIEGQDLLFLNGPHEAPFTEAISMVATCRGQAELDRVWAALLDGGEPLQCGWLKDRFGLCWQIVPDGMGEILGGPDQAGAQRALQAMLGMVKLDIHALRAAYDGASN